MMGHRVIWYYKEDLNQSYSSYHSREFMKTNNINSWILVNSFKTYQSLLFLRNSKWLSIWLNVCVGLGRWIVWFNKLLGIDSFLAAIACFDNVREDRGHQRQHYRFPLFYCILFQFLVEYKVQIPKGLKYWGE